MAAQDISQPSHEPCTELPRNLHAVIFVRNGRGWKGVGKAQEGTLNGETNIYFAHDKISVQSRLKNTA